MKIIYTDDFLNDLYKIIAFIAKDSLSRAVIFNNALLDEISQITYMPLCPTDLEKTKN